MKILIATPASRNSTRGNRVTANRYSALLVKAGFHVVTVDSRNLTEISQSGYDVLIALHAGHSSAAIRSFRIANPKAAVVVVITGTDINRDLNRSPESYVHKKVTRSLSLADRIVVLQPLAATRIPRKWRNKVAVVHQSCSPLEKLPAKYKNRFSVVVSGHLRAVKDPFRAVLAARMLPESSKIHVTQIGRPLTAGMKQRAEQLVASELRYSFRNSLTHRKAVLEMARSDLLVNASSQEGAPMAVIEAIVNGVPVLLSRIDAHVGLVGSRYSGLFEFGDTKGLASLMLRAENDRKFYDRLCRQCEAIKPQFEPVLELRLWRKLLNELR
ncbi:MAG: glycosyltransferase [Planctomycetota bacterium]